MEITGNIVTPGQVGFGEIAWQGTTISRIVFRDAVRTHEPWILPGFIEMHLHGSGPYNVENGAESICGMADYLASRGVTRFLPTYSCAPYEELENFVAVVKQLVKKSPRGAIIEGSHVEGPWLSPHFCGGMLPETLNLPDLQEARRLLETAHGTLKMMTIAPELPGALEVIRFMTQHGVIMSSGHSACPPEMLEAAVQVGLSEICHLFDCYELPEDHGGVRQPALTDLVLIHDQLMKEIIMDGLHVPPELVILARRAAGADHIIAITDALQGAGLPEGHFLDCGRPYTIRDGEVARRDEDGVIVGSSLTMNRAYFNMTSRFGFTPQEASWALAGNQAKQLKIDHLTGSLQEGKAADIAVLAPDQLTVQATYVSGEQVFSD